MSDAPLDAVREIARRHRRYPLDAYLFIFEGLDAALKRLGRAGGHISGRELLEGIRIKAVDEFGGLARLVLRMWNIESTEDIGAMVFHLVDGGLMGRQETDSLDDFRNVYTFDEAFPLIPKEPIGG